MLLRFTGVAALLFAAAVAVLPAPATAETDIIPLPVYATSRNGGDDFGVMPVFLMKENEYIYAIIAPSVIYNENTGLNLTFRYFGYPSVDKNYKIFINRSLGVDHESTVEYWDKKFIGGKFRTYGRISYFRDSTYRFFGLTEKSREEDEANYSNVEFTPEFCLGYYLPNNLELSLSERLRWVTIRRGTADTLPYIQNQFRGLDGVNGGAALRNRLALTYDTRDDEVYPGDGWYASVYGAVNVGFTGSRVYTKAGLDVRKYISLDSKRFITVLKGAFELTGGGHVPFYERSYIGGENSMRGYGTFRFTDDGFITVNIEERIRLFKLYIYGVWSEWEAAPFVDIGRVYSSFSHDFFRHYKVNPGVGFRAIVEPNVVGRVDLGYSDEGIAAFVGLDFPF